LGKRKRGSGREKQKLRKKRKKKKTSQRLFPLRAKRLPIFPKQTQLQNNTLKIHTAPSTPSLPTPFPIPIPCSQIVPFEGELAGLGKMFGFEARRRAVPVVEMVVERRKPGLERSIRYHRAGLTRARVRDAWREEAHGTLRIANAIPTKAPTLLTTGVQSALHRLSPPFPPRIPPTGLLGPVTSPFLLFFESLLESFISSSKNRVSNQGRSEPNETPATPHNTRYPHPPLGLIIPSTWNGANCRSSCRCLTNNPYPIPIPNRRMLLSTNPYTTADVEIGGGV
jgi:hypothetical protein